MLYFQPNPKQRWALRTMVQDRTRLGYLAGGRWVPDSTITVTLVSRRNMGLPVAYKFMTRRDMMALESVGYLARAFETIDDHSDGRKLTEVGWELGRTFLPKKLRDKTPAELPKEMR